jgi:hypothetical protein
VAIPTAEFRINRLLKNSFSMKKSCENPNEIKGQFFKTWLFQQPVNAVWKGEKPPAGHSKLNAGFRRQHLMIGPFIYGEPQQVGRRPNPSISFLADAMPTTTA